MNGAYLRDFAHCRAGDKGNDSLLVVIPYRTEDLQRLVRVLRPEQVARHFCLSSTEGVSIKAVTGLGVLVIIIRGLLAGGVTRASGADPHGKTLSSHLLDLPLPTRPLE